jgi:hypothetical protein
MSAYTITDRGQLAVTFSREGHLDDQRVADYGFKAVSTAMRMLAFLDALRPGDILKVERASD